MIQTVENNLIFGNLNQDNGQPHQMATNKDFVIALLIDCISSLFPNLNKVQIEAFVWNLFNHCYDWQKFKGTLRDLLISMKSFSAGSDEFYEDERKVNYFLFKLLQIALEESKKKEDAKRNAIPGLLKPSEAFANQSANGQYIQ